MDLGRRWVGPVLLSAAASTVMTVDTDHMAHLLHLHVFNNDTVTRTFTCSIGIDAAGSRIYDQAVIQPKQPLDDTGLYILKTGEIVQAFSDSANKLTMTWTGVDVTVDNPAAVL